MADVKQAVPQHKGYYVGEIATQVDQVVAKPDGTAISDKEVLAEILNKLDMIYKLIKESL